MKNELNTNVDAGQFVPLDAKHLLAEIPCKNHKPKQLSYLAWHDWASKMTGQSKKQTQCNKCGRWYFKSEM